MNTTATAKQTAYITSLLTKRDTTGTPYAGHTVAPEGLTKAQASAAIDALTALPHVHRTDALIDTDRRPAAEHAAPGFYTRDGAAYRVVENKARTATYAQQWDADDRGWVYAPGVGRTLADLTPMTGEQAAALGLASGVCIRCCRTLGGDTLSAKVSALIGYGETCAGHEGWAYPTGTAAQRAYIAERTEQPATV